ncbi:VOC family protein [Hyphococcus sp.]|uniref:VOC family protein n=1 Tax=Hyphococcus sp. TaxID=2038636 RepID=UPI003CCBF67B
MIHRISATLSGAMLILLNAACAAQVETQSTLPPSFLAVIVTDADASAQWYADVFNMREIRDRGANGFEQLVLTSDHLNLEIIEMTPTAPAAPNRALGLFKYGVTVADFDTFVAGLRERNVTFFGDGRVILDKALGLHSTILLDPDGNRIQIFGVSDLDTKYVFD